MDVPAVLKRCTSTRRRRVSGSKPPESRPRRSAIYRATCPLAANATREGNRERTMENTLAAQQSGSDGLRGAKLFLYAAIILLIAEFIGSFTFKVGPGKVVLLPMILALLLRGAP